jgi:hypothetical protein
MPHCDDDDPRTEPTTRIGDIAERARDRHRTGHARARARATGAAPIAVVAAAAVAGGAVGRGLGARIAGARAFSERAPSADDRQPRVRRFRAVGPARGLGHRSRTRSGSAAAAGPQPRPVLAGGRRGGALARASARRARGCAGGDRMAGRDRESILDAGDRSDQPRLARVLACVGRRTPRHARRPVDSGSRTRRLGRLSAGAAFHRRSLAAARWRCCSRRWCGAAPATPTLRARCWPNSTAIGTTNARRSTPGWARWRRSCARGAPTPAATRRRRGKFCGRPTEDPRWVGLFQYHPRVRCEHANLQALIHRAIALDESMSMHADRSGGGASCGAASIAPRWRWRTKRSCSTPAASTASNLGWSLWLFERCGLLGDAAAKTVDPLRWIGLAAWLGGRHGVGGGFWNTIYLLRMARRQRPG